MLRSDIIENSYSVEYINRSVAGKSRAYALYVRSTNLQDLKYKLVSGMEHISRFLQKEMLFAVYLDLVSTSNYTNSAFEELSADIRKGLVSKVLLADVAEITDNLVLNAAMLDLINEIAELEYTDMKGNLVQSLEMPMRMLIGV